MVKCGRVMEGVNVRTRPCDNDVTIHHARDIPACDYVTRLFQPGRTTAFPAGKLRRRRRSGVSSLFDTTLERHGRAVGARKWHLRRVTYPEPREAVGVDSGKP